MSADVREIYSSRFLMGGTNDDGPDFIAFPQQKTHKNRQRSFELIA
jgi:hypothetical protein